MLFTENYLNTKGNFIKYKAFREQSNIIKYLIILLYEKA